MSKFKIGDLVQHRASGQRGVVCEVREESESVPARYEYRLDAGYSVVGMNRSALESWDGEHETWLPEYVLRASAEHRDLSMMAAGPSLYSEAMEEALIERLASKVAEKLAAKA